MCVTTEKPQQNKKESSNSASTKLWDDYSCLPDKDNINKSNLG